jgi:hypothetical protein
MLNLFALQEYSDVVIVSNNEFFLAPDVGGIFREGSSRFFDDPMCVFLTLGWEELKKY